MDPENLVCLNLVRSPRDEVKKSVTAFLQDCFVEEILICLGHCFELLLLLEFLLEKDGGLPFEYRKSSILFCFYVTSV